MKYIILTAVTILFMTLVSFVQEDNYYDFSPDLRYEVHGNYKRAVRKEKLNTALLIGDFVPGYPSNWISNYTSVEILVTSSDKTISAVSKNDVLNQEQKRILNTADYATNIAVNVKYTYKNPTTKEIENNKINILMTVVPEKEAEYVGGYQQMIKYLKDSSIKQISGTSPGKFQRVIIGFTVNEKGEVCDVNVTTASGDAKADKLLLEVISKMPKWKPAENAKGEKIKQEFEFSINGSGGGC